MSEAQPLLSVCMIVRDEEQRLPAALRSVEGLADEVVVVDTGSTDGTRALAEEHGCRVLGHPWSGDFSAARNVALQAAEGQWCLTLDADEVLRCEEGFDLRALLAGDPQLDFGLVRVLTPDHRGEQEQAWILRLVRSSRGWRYRYPVHEQLDVQGGRGQELPLSILHLGCLDEERTRARQASYLEMLDGLPEDSPHRIVFTVRSLVALGRWGDIEPWAQRAWKGLPPDHEQLPRLLFQGAVAAFNRDDRAATAVWIRRGLSLFPQHPDLHFVAMAHSAWLAKLAWDASDDPGHRLFRRVGDSRRWEPAVDALLAALGVRQASPAQ